MTELEVFFADSATPDVLGLSDDPPPLCIVWVSLGEHSGSGSQLNILVIELTKLNDDAISKFIPPNAPKPKPLGILPARAAPLPAIASNILGLNEARPPAAEIKFGMSPILIAWKAFPIPDNKFSLTPNKFEAKDNPAAIPFGLDLSLINDNASAIKDWLSIVFWLAASMNEINPRP